VKMDNSTTIINNNTTIINRPQRKKGNWGLSVERALGSIPGRALLILC
jgi:hypothetical protein